MMDIESNVSFSTATNYKLGAITDNEDSFDSEENNQVHHLPVTTGSISACNTRTT